jgi:Domain of unknown function (DUF1844)
MAWDSVDEGFKVTDRRGRSEPAGADTPAPPRVDDRAAPEPTSASPAADLTGLFVMFATSALIAMGESADPVTGRVQKNLAQASEAIELLMLLRAKTEGNRTTHEDEVLSQLLYDLQLRFVRAKKAAPS